MAEVRRFHAGRRIESWSIAMGQAFQQDQVANGGGDQNGLQGNAGAGQDVMALGQGEGGGGRQARTPGCACNDLATQVFCFTP
jgi:hypothetical protein